MITTQYKYNWDFLKRKFETDHLSHAYILLGVDREEKQRFTKEFAKSINCIFPDFFIVEKQEDKHIISIDQVKKIQEFLHLKSFYGSYKIIVVQDAELMNHEAQSCFLKTLEEPQGKAMIFLSSSKPDLLLPTIHSRCQTLHFSQQQSQVIEPDEETRQLVSILQAGLAEKFKYAKQVDEDGKNIKNILTLMEWHFREVLLANLENKDIRKKTEKTLQIIDRVQKKVLFTNVSQRLALETVLMNI